MLDAPTGRHPLGVAGVDDPAMSGAVVMLEGALDNEGHRLHAAVRMRGKSACVAIQSSAMTMKGSVTVAAWTVDQQARLVTIDVARSDCGVARSRSTSRTITGSRVSIMAAY